MLNHVDLCSGIGGFALGFEWAGLSRPILFCDIEPWSRQILKKHWPDVPICEDVKEIAADPDRFIPGRVDILTAGYPCQPFSVAGNQRGTEDPRHIYPYISRIVARKRPTWCVFENVYGHVSLGLDEVLNDLESQGYATRPFIVGASAVNAPHKRDRLWIIARNMAHTNSVKWRPLQEPQGRQQEETIKRQSTSNCRSDVADTRCEYGQQRNSTHLEEEQTIRSSCTVHSESGGQGQITTEGSTRSEFRQMADGIPSRVGRFGEHEGWEKEPEGLKRVAVGVPDRVSKLRGLGNAIVPQIAQKIGETILKLESLNEKKNKD